jgi:hypothetical protein
VTAAAAALAGAGTAHASTLPTHNTKGATPAVKTFKTAVSPGSAFGCNQETCIGVIGGGLHVSYWYTTGSDTYADRCTQPAYWVAGDVAFYGSQVCGKYSYYSSTGLSNYNFPRTAQVCNTWVNGPKGKPCETVKS